MRLLACLTSFALIAVTPLLGQRSKQDKAAGYDKAARAVILHAANVYTSPDDNASHTALVTPGHEVIILERSGPWLRVFANTEREDAQNEDDTPEFSADEGKAPPSGWIKNKGVINNESPNGDQILFGAAADFEDQASQPHAPKDAANAAKLLYRRVPDYYPNSPLAAQAMYRAADIRWQLDKRGISDLPSAKEQEAYLRPQLYDGELRRVMKQYPGSPEAAMAGYDLIDMKLCGDWQGLPKCPEMESTLYQKYANQFPDGPKTAQALWEATYRQGVLVTMYQDEDSRKRAEGAAANAKKLADEMRQRFPKSDYTARAVALSYRLQQGINVYGSDRE